MKSNPLSNSSHFFNPDRLVEKRPKAESMDLRVAVGRGPYPQRWGFFRPSVSRAAILARARTIPEFVITASGHRFSAALRKRAKSSSVILTFTWTVLFIPPCI